jgi:alkanesulfonate monooxygenase SsuD/methylene tetrahydromethanopterin reductase-like flavin-dependent oxidoreductase (luciferase family)
MAMKVRFGFTCRGQADLALDDFPRLVDDLERLGFDSLWLPERMLNGPFAPLVGLAHAAARTARLKLGAYVIVPGRNPVRLARALANLDRLSGGRLLLIMVLEGSDYAARLRRTGGAGGHVSHRLLWRGRRSRP